VNLFYIN